MCEIENQPLRLLKVLGHGHNGSGIGGFQRTNKSEASCWSGGQNQNAGAAFRRKTKRLRHFVHYVGRLSSCRSGFGRAITRSSSRNARFSANEIRKGGLSQAALYSTDKDSSLSRVNAGRDGMTTIRADGGAAAAECSQEDDCAECGEKNGSHDNLVTVFLTIRKQSRR